MRPEDLGIGKLFERIRDAVIVADAATQQIVLWNQAAANLFGYPISEALELRVEALVPEHLKARHRTGIAWYSETGHGPYIDSHGLLELPAVRKNGQEIYVELSLSPIGLTGDTEDAGRRFVLAIVRDVTERKRSEEALREAEKRFRSAFGDAPIGIAVVSLEGRYMQVNRSLCEILGYSEEKLLSTTYKDITYPEDFDVSMHYARQIVEGEPNKYHLEKRYLHADGHPVWVSLNVSLVRDSEGHPLYFISQVQDISERKSMEEALRESEQRLRSSFEDAAIGMALVGIDGRWLQVNRSLCGIVGYSKQELLNKTFQDITHPDDLEVDLDYVRRLLAGEIETYQMEKRYLHKKGHVVWILLNVSLVRDTNSHPLYFIAQVQDITQRKEAEQEIQRLNESLEEQVAERTAQLVESERRLKHLVGKILVAQEEERRRVAYEVHDGPTQVAIAAHQHLQDFAYTHPPDSTVGEEKLGRALELAQRTVKEGRRIIEGLRPMGLDDLGLAAAVQLHVEDLKKEGWQIDYEEALSGQRLSPEIETALYRIMQEALTNVQKHAHTTKAHIKLASLKSRIHLEVRDEGCGFDLSVSERQNSGPGERVGIQSMHERVALLGGTLEIESKPGEGTTLVAEVPLSATHEEADISYEG